MVQSLGGDDEVEKAVGDDCPIPRTHAVLNDAHWHWHQALSAYPDPRAFRASVNALIQTLRNVTWVLQSEKHGVPNFEVWYAGWQARLKADPVLRWLVDTRNAAVKRGELKTKSKARVALTFDWAGERAVRHLDVPALMRTEDIPNAVRVHVPEAVRETAFLRVDRRWVADRLPDWELLDALGHCYGVIANVASDAHATANREVETTHPHEALRPRGNDGRLACMVAAEDQRTVVLNLATNATLQPAITRLEVDDAAMRRAAKKYKVESPSQVTDDPFVFAQQCVEQAKKVLAKDKYHRPFVWLFHPGGVEVIGIPAEDQQQKIFSWERVSNEVRRLGATAVLSIAETWLGPFEDAARGVPPSRSRDRKEAIDVTVASSDGRSLTYLTVFRRRFGRIVFEPTVAMDGAGQLFLEPVRRVWNGMRPLRKKD